MYDVDGELVCTKPFPSMPIYFGDDPEGAKYNKAYFEKFEGRLPPEFRLYYIYIYPLTPLL